MIRLAIASAIFLGALNTHGCWLIARSIENNRDWGETIFTICAMLFSYFFVAYLLFSVEKRIKDELNNFDLD